MASITALEVDAIQHAKNLLVADLPHVGFALGGAEDIPAPDASFDIAFMFKSLHHVPVEKMDRALGEIRRVLRPGGLAYISEPIYAGEYNEILRLFHDEKRVREAAFAALCRAVESGLLELAREFFFSTPLRFSDFAEFEEKVLRVTHTRHELSPQLHAEVRRKFLEHATPKGVTFFMPMRVDLLRRPG